MKFSLARRRGATRYSKNTRPFKSHAHFTRLFKNPRSNTLERCSRDGMRSRLEGGWVVGVLGHRGTSLTRNSASLGPYSRTMPRSIWWSEGEGAVSSERGTPVPCPSQCKDFSRGKRGVEASSSDTTYQFNGFRKSIPPQNRPLIVYYYNKLTICGRVDFLRPFN